MSLSKAFITGKVTRPPEKRFTSNNLAIAAFTINLTDDEETPLRIITVGQIAEKVADTVSKNDMVVVEGRLQTNSAKTESGEEKRFFEVQASAVEKMSGSTSSAPKQEEDLLTFNEEEFADDLIGEDEIPF